MAEIATDFPGDGYDGVGLGDEGFAAEGPDEAERIGVEPTLVVDGCDGDAGCGPIAIAGGLHGAGQFISGQADVGFEPDAEESVGEIPEIGFADGVRVAGDAVVHGDAAVEDAGLLAVRRMTWAWRLLKGGRMHISEKSSFMQCMPRSL